MSMLHFSTISSALLFKSTQFTTVFIILRCGSTCSLHLEWHALCPFPLCLHRWSDLLEWLIDVIVKLDGARGDLEGHRVPRSGVTNIDFRLLTVFGTTGGIVYDFTRDVLEGIG